MPPDDGGWFDQHHGVKELRANPVKPHPDGPACREGTKLTRAFPPQDSHVMSQGDELKIHGGAAANAEREQGYEGGKIYEHARNSMAVTRKFLAFIGLLEF